MQPQQTTTRQPVTVIVKVQQTSGPSSLSVQPTSYVVNDQQPGTSRQMIFNPPSVAPSQQEESQTTLLDYPVSSQLFPVCFSINRWTHHSHFHPLNFNQHRHTCHLPLIMNIQDLPASPASRVKVSPNQWISPHKSYQTRPLLGPPESSKNN